jgi:hypothetical protein
MLQNPALASWYPPSLAFLTTEHSPWTLPEPFDLSRINGLLRDLPQAYKFPCSRRLAMT